MLPVNPFGGWLGAQPQMRYLLSVVPKEFTWLSLHATETTYRLRKYDPAKKIVADPEIVGRDVVCVEQPCTDGQGYSVLRLSDTFQVIRNYTNDTLTNAPVPVGAVVENLMTQWSVNPALGAGFRPGIIEIAGMEPTEEELRTAHDMQSAMCQALVNKADDFDRQGKVSEITQVYRDAAIYLQLTDRPWFKGYERKALKPCVACGEQINSAALVCQKCGTNLPLFYEQIQMVPDESADPVVFNVWRVRNGKASAMRQPPPTSQPQPAAVAAAR